MTDHTLPGAVSPAAGAQAIQRLADRLTGLVPPPAAIPLAGGLPQPSPAVAAALARSAHQARDAAYRARRRPSLLAIVFIPYSLVALALRLVIARVFFLDGQGKIDGPHLAYSVQGFDFHGLGFRGFDLSVIVPTQVKVETVASVFDYTESAMLSTIIAYVLSYAEFALPIMLVLGLGTRFVALALFGLTVLMQLYVTPQELWSAHIYWASILVVLISLGAGQISLDRIVRALGGR